MAVRSNKIERLKRKKEAERLLTALIARIRPSQQDNPDAEDDDTGFDEDEIRYAKLADCHNCKLFCFTFYISELCIT